MVRHGTAPFIECSSKGEMRLSAFGARIKRRGNRTIEDVYQAAKVFDDGQTGLRWRAAKGKKAVNQAEVHALYGQLWDEYIWENQDLLEMIKGASGLQDMFGQPGHACQATELWRIRGEALGLPLEGGAAGPAVAPATGDLFAGDGPTVAATGAEAAPRRERKGFQRG